MWSFLMFTLIEDITLKDLWVCYLLQIYCSRRWHMEWELQYLSYNHSVVASIHEGLSMPYSRIWSLKLCTGCPDLFQQLHMQSEPFLSPLWQLLKIYWHLFCSLPLIFVIFALRETGRVVLFSFDLGGKWGGEVKTLFALSMQNKYPGNPSTWSLAYSAASQGYRQQTRRGCQVTAFRILLSFFSLSTLPAGLVLEPISCNPIYILILSFANL